MEEILEEILKELQYQTRLMENIYHKKDESNHQLNDHINTIRNMVLSNPMVSKDPNALKMLTQMFESLGGKK